MADTHEPPSTRPPPMLALGDADRVFGITMAALTVGAGVLIRTAEVSPGLAKFGGVALWCALVYWLLVVWRPRASIIRGVVTAGLVGIAVELLQLTSFPRAVAEALPMVRWVLGTTFIWSDLPAYAVGACSGGAAHWVFRRRMSRP